MNQKSKTNAKPKKKKIIQFKSENKSESLENNLDTFDMKHPLNRLVAKHQTNVRKIHKESYKILDAPGLQDDFY